MKPYYFILLFLLCSCHSINITNTKTKPYKNSKGDFIGVVNKTILKENCSWFDINYNHYTTNKETIKKLNKLDKSDIKILIFMGTWCGDSKEEVPRFYKVTDNINFNSKNIETIAVNHKKKANGLQKGYNIKRIPTFIILKNNKEIGRIIEHPKQDSSIEDDVLNILNTKK